jgi:hypothetical protein
LCYDFAAVEKILRQCSQWRESITEVPENFTHIRNLSSALNLRKDLWNYYEVTFQHVRDWKNVSIKKVCIYILFKIIIFE